MPKKTTVVLHHSLTADSGTVSWGAIRRYHTAPKPEGMGMREIGYQYGVELAGDRYETLVGRMEDEVAAAAPGANEDGIHVCLVGNFDVGPVPPDQFAAAARLVASIARRHSIPVSRIFGHNHFNAHKSCPGAQFPLERFREAVGKAL